MTQDNQNKGWIAVDLDGTLAEYFGWVDGQGIGKPIPLMVNRVKDWLKEGKDVRIFTARAGPQLDEVEKDRMIYEIRDWLENVGLPRDLEITATKDFRMIELWDDRCIQVIPNSGVSVVDYYTEKLTKMHLSNSYLRAKDRGEVE